MKIIFTKFFKQQLKFFLLVFFVFLIGCEPDIELPHEHEISDWIYYDQDTKCNEDFLAVKVCLTCDQILEEEFLTKEHDLHEETTSISCTDGYKIYTKCHNCNYQTQKIVKGEGHVLGEYIILKEASANTYGIKQRGCENCDYQEEQVEFVNNTFSFHGKLSVQGADLVDSNNQKFQLIGLSTHGLQWFGRYVNYDTFNAIKNEFGINVIRLAMYTAENGYCSGNAAQQKYMYDTVVKGIEIATELDLYVIIDWHMVGAESIPDKNPLTYVNESVEFFGKISSQFADHDNILYEIMNEPNGSTTWQDCKDYANQVIKEIRKNSDGIVLVGNPKWTADLNSVVNSPLEGYTNIMYTYHFYAADHKNTTQVVNAYDKGFPVFISEHGAMYSDGNRNLDYSSIRNWYSVLDSRNISYVAWNISNSSGSASIIKTTNVSFTDFSDSGLKVWGRWYKIWTRTKAGLPVYGSVDENTEKQ